MQCPQCSGEVWNNAQKNEQRARDGKKPMPLLTCKDKDGCGWVKWPPKGQAPTGNRGQGGSSAGGAPKRPLGPLYYDCLKMAKLCVEKEVKNYTTADVIAAAATLFIAATRDGTPLQAPKPKPAPPPEPEYEEDFEPTDEIPF